MRSGFIKVQNSVEHIEIRVAFLETLHILDKASGGDFSVWSANTRVLHIANLHHIFIEALALVGGGNNGLRDFPLESVLIVACFYLPVGSFLPCVVTLNDSAE